MNQAANSREAQMHLMLQEQINKKHLLMARQQEIPSLTNGNHYAENDILDSSDSDTVLKDHDQSSQASIALSATLKAPSDPSNQLDLDSLPLSPILESHTPGLWKGLENLSRWR